MRNLIIIFVFLFLSPQVSFAQNTTTCAPPAVCVPKPDLDTFVSVSREKQCLQSIPPVVTADPVTVIVDRKGRIYGSGNEPRPYTIKIKWCNYDIEAKSSLQLQVAQRIEPTWGFRFRLKAALGGLVADVVRGHKFQEVLDGGLLFEPFFIRWANLNGFVGFRSVGLGLGFDLTNNFGLFAGYTLTWGSWRSNPLAAVSFAF